VWRFKPSDRFIKQVLEADHNLQQTIFPALRKLCQNPDSKGVNLEAFSGRDGFYTARVTDKIRFLLMERQDDEGTYLEIVRFGSHDDTY